MKRRLTVFYCMFFIGTLLRAHPHMFFSSRFDVIFDGENLKGAYCEWTFDAFFSADIILGFDLNRDGVFDKAETKEIYENAFIYTKNYYFFTFIRQGNKRSNPSYVSDFSASYEKGIVTYRFFIDLSQYPREDIYLATYDYTFFCDIRYTSKEPVKFIYDPLKVSPRYSIHENKNYPVYYSPFCPPDDTRVYYKWEKGLETYYPYEVKIQY